MRDYEKLVKGLRYCFEHDDCGSRCPYFSTTTVCADERAKEAADAIEELLTAVPHWISVEERLPEIGRFVLVSDGDDIDVACRYKAFTIPDKTETFFWDSVLEVTHWMPLPEPPKED